MYRLRMRCAVEGRERTYGVGISSTLYSSSSLSSIPVIIFISSLTFSLLCLFSPPLLFSIDTVQELESFVHKRDKDKKELIERAEDFEQLAMKRLEKVGHTTHTHPLLLCEGRGLSLLSALSSTSFRSHCRSL